jgi:hypothetical protein
VGRQVDDHQWGETENDMTTITAHEQQDINVSTTDSGAARELRFRLWAEHLACTEDDLRHTAPTAILDGRWVAAAHKQQCIVARRSGPLTAPLYPYPLGHRMAAFGPGEGESALLPR